MKLWGLQAYQLAEIVQSVSDEHFGGNLAFNRFPTETKGPLNFTLRVVNSKGPGAAISRHRRTCSACYHAHWRVMNDVFKANPGARTRSALGDYRGTAVFMMEAPYINYPNTCEC